MDQLAIDPVVNPRNEEATVARCQQLKLVIEFDAGSDPGPLRCVIQTDGPVVDEVGHGAPRVVRREQLAVAGQSSDDLAARRIDHVGDRCGVARGDEVGDEGVRIAGDAEGSHVALSTSIHHQSTDRSTTVESPFDDPCFAIARRHLDKPRAVVTDSQATDTTDLRIEQPPDFQAGGGVEGGHLTRWVTAQKRSDPLGECPDGTVLRGLRLEPQRLARCDIEAIHSAEAHRDHLLPVPGEEDVEVARLLRTVEALELGAGVRVDDADRTGEGADGQVAIRGERHCRRHRQQEGVVGPRQPAELVEQLPRRPVTNLDAPRLSPADDDECSVVADRHRPGQIRYAHGVEPAHTGLDVPDGHQAELGSWNRNTRPPQGGEVTPLLVHLDVGPAADLIIIDERVKLPPLAGRQVDDVNRADGVAHGHGVRAGKEGGAGAIVD